MKIYIAMPYPERGAAVALMEKLERAGFTVTSRWLRTLVPDSPEGAKMDLEDIDACDTLLFVQTEEWVDKGRGGRHTELGYALAKEKLVVLVGAKSNVFHEIVLHIDNMAKLERIWNLS